MIWIHIAGWIIYRIIFLEMSNKLWHMDLRKSADWVNSKGQFDFQKLSNYHEYKNKKKSECYNMQIRVLVKLWNK